MMSQFKAGALLSYGALAINILIGLLYTPWVIRSIGTDDYGLYTLALSIISIFVFDFGLSTAITRYLSKYICEGSQQKANDCLGLVYKLYIRIDIIILIVLILVYIFIPHIYEKLTSEEINKFKIVYIIASSFSFLSFPFIPLNGILVANEKFVQLKTCDIINKLTIVCLMSFCLLSGYGLYALVGVNAVAGLCTILLKLFFIKRDTQTKANFKYTNKTEQRQILSFSGWVTVTSICQRMIFNIAPTILGIMSGSVSIAILGVAITIEGYAYTFANALSGMFLPKVSWILAKDKNILPLMIKVGRLQLIIISAFIVGFVCLGNQFISLWVGDRFSGTYICAIMLLVPSFFQLPQEVASTALVAAKRVKQQAIAYIAMAIANISLAFILAKYYGAVGVALSICCAYLLRTVILNIIYYRELNIDIKSFFKNCYFRMLPAISVCFLITFAFCRLDLPGWGGLILKGTFFIITFSVSIWFLALNGDEKQLLSSLLPFSR